MPKPHKLLITKSPQGEILEVLSTSEVEVLVVTDTEQGGISAATLGANKLDRAAFREHSWDALAVGLDSSSAEEKGVHIDAPTIKFLQKL